MKHLQTFEKFDQKNEWFGQKFVTGHEQGEKEQAILRIEKEIESAIEEYLANPDLFMEYDIDELRENLIEQAKHNGYRGKVEIRQSANDPKSANANLYFIMYVPEYSPLQQLGAAAGSQFGR
jgi:hypothetical protein